MGLMTLRYDGHEGSETKGWESMYDIKVIHNLSFFFVNLSKNTITTNM